jgi:crotonobetainyl-CoA:carnitine CoA-transferase CaiB-like acyl-CoA transferase
MVRQALDDLRVLDFTRGMAGPLATMVMADFGAEVIRVEPPGGDPLWSHPAYLLWNRGKKSIDLDLRSSGGQELLADLVKGCDVIVESFRPGQAERLGIGYERASSLNPSLVYCSISAFGQDGPYKNLKPYDGIVNAKSGRMHDQVGHYRTRPVYRGVNDTSYHTAMFAVQGILAALRVAWITGEGQHVSTSLLRGVTAPNNPWRRFDGVPLPPDLYPGQKETNEVRRGELVPDRREADPYTAIPSQLCTECKDGRWIMHAHVQPELFKAWIRTIGFEWIWDDPRYQGAPSSYPTDKDRVDLNLLILDRMKEKTAAEWIRLYTANPDCAGEIMQTTQEALHHPQFRVNGHVVAVTDPRVGPTEQVGPFVKMSETPAASARPAPVPGQDTEQVLSGRPGPRPPFRMPGSKPTRPLEGVTIIELATWLAAPFGGALLADLGARVIKVEPHTGDPFRRMLTNENMIRTMQGKEPIAVDLKSEAGQQILHRLVARADALFHNFRPGAPERLGVDYETVRRIKPDIVYLHAASYGSAGEYSKRAAFNPTIGAFAGNSVFQSGEGNIPIGDQSPDPISGSGVATGMMLGLAARWRTGLGQYLETTMMNSVVYCNSDDALNYNSKPDRRNPDQLQLGLEATYRLYETSDGWVFLAAPFDAEFRRFCQASGLDHLAGDDRFLDATRRYENRHELAEALQAVFATRAADEWEAQLTAADVACVRADRTGHRRFLHEDPHARAIDFMVPTRHRLFESQAAGGRYWRHGPVSDFSATPCEAGQPFSDIGEMTIPILLELGYSEEEVKRLSDMNVIHAPAPLDELVRSRS